MKTTKKILNKIFNPRTVALIGVSARKNSVGRGIFENLLEGAKLRKIYPVNPNYKKIFGRKSFHSILDIKNEIDLAIIAVPSWVVLKIVKECSQKRVGGIVIISAGFSETGKKGKILEKKIGKEVKKTNIPLIGPNVLGIIRPSVKLNASFAPAAPKKGKIGLVSQSGALIDSIIDKSLLENYGFSSIISTGNETNLCVTDFLEYLVSDKETKVIALYIEGLKDGKRFLKIAKKCSSKKPIVAIKSGKSQIGGRAVSSHTGALAGDYQVYKAAFEKANIFEVQTIEELLEISKTLAWQPRTKNGIGIITNGGGCGILAADFCEDSGIELTKLKKETIRNINRSPFSHSGWSKKNPVDIIGDDNPKRYKVAVENLLKQKNINGLIVIETLQVMTNPLENAKEIVKLHKKYPQKPIISCFLGGKYTRPGVEFLEKNKIPNFSNLKTAVLAMKALLLL